MKEVTFPAGWLAQDVARAAQRQTEWRDAVPAAQTRDGEAMSENIPQTLDEITAAINNECYNYMLTGEAEHLTKLIFRWRKAWLRDAEPRLRPVTETPQAGDLVVRVYVRFAPTIERWESEYNLGSQCTGWYLIKRATVPLTHEEALRLLVTNIRCLGNAPEYLLVALAKAEEALRGEKP